MNEYYFPSWLQSLTQIRNIIAHHGRLWNKNLPGRPRLLKNAPHPWLNITPGVSEHFRLYIHLSIMKYLLNRISSRNKFTKQLELILNKYPDIDTNALGLTKDWSNEPLWSE